MNEKTMKIVKPAPETPKVSVPLSPALEAAHAARQREVARRDTLTPAQRAQEDLIAKVNEIHSAMVAGHGNLSRAIKRLQSDLPVGAAVRGVAFLQADLDALRAQVQGDEPAGFTL